MRNNVLSYLLLPLFASLSFSLSAAPASATAVPEPVPVVSQQQGPAAAAAGPEHRRCADVAEGIERHREGQGRGHRGLPGGQWAVCFGG